MKYPSLLITSIFAVFLISCGAKKEKTEDLNNTNEASLEKPAENDTSFTDFVDQGSPKDSLSYDTTNVERSTYIDPTKGIQIDPPVVNKTENKIEKKIEAKKETKKQESKEIVKSHELRYYVVAGSFKKYSNAHNLVDYFKRKGYKPLILPKSKGYNRVAIVSFPKESEARTSIKQLRTDHKDLAFWLYKW
jgi:cell division septation protein DedD